MTAILFNELSSNFNDFLLIDVRTPPELEQFGRVPGAINIPVQELDEALELEGKDFEKRYGITIIQKDDSSLVFYCRSGKRIEKAHEILKSKGFLKQRFYYGSFNDWKENGGEVEIGLENSIKSDTEKQITKDIQNISNKESTFIPTK